MREIDVTKCANEIEEFRCRFFDGKPVIYDKINTSFTYLDNGSELFKVVKAKGVEIEFNEIV